MKISIDFPGANGIRFEPAAPDRLRFEADPMGGPYTLWFHFRVENPGCEVLHCEMANAAGALCWRTFAPHVRPVFRRAGDSWQRTPPTAPDLKAGVFRFEVECRRQSTEIAFCYPYQAGDWESFFKARLLPGGARLVPIGRSAGGRPLEACEFGTGQPAILITARSHAGETPGSFIMEGLLTRLLTERARLSMSAIPFIDVDGVATGAYGKDRAPVDFWMDWGGAPKHPEIRQYKDYLASLSARPALAIDCHAPTADGANFIECSSCRDAPAGFAGRLEELVRRIARKCAAAPATELQAANTRPHPDWYPDGFEHSLSGFIQSAYGAPAFTLETAYHATHRGCVVGPDEWRAQGRCVAEAALEFLDNQR